MENPAPSSGIKSIASNTIDLSPLVPSKAVEQAQAIAVLPAYVSQRNCLAVLGLNSRTFRANVHKYRIPHCRLGKQVLVRLEDWHAALANIALQSPTSDPADWTEEAILNRVLSNKTK